MIDPVRSRRGRTNRRRGNDFERSLATELGGRRIGQYGEPADVLTPLLASRPSAAAPSASATGAGSSAIPRTGGRIPVLVVGDAPGPGHRRRAFVVIELGDFRDLHGEDADGP